MTLTGDKIQSSENKEMNTCICISKLSSGGDYKNKSRYTHTPGGKLTSSETKSKVSLLIAISLTPADKNSNNNKANLHVFPDGNEKFKFHQNELLIRKDFLQTTVKLRMPTMCAVVSLR